MNTSLMNLSRTGPQNPDDYDLQSVAAHEMDEVLGIGGSGSFVGATYFGTGSPLNYPTGPVGSMDLFRYASNGVRSYTTSTSATAYFSIDGGKTKLRFFNQTQGADYGDWAPGQAGPPEVQDAYGTPGVDVDIGVNELTALNVVGYTLPTVPEPGTGTLFLGGLIVVGIICDAADK
ncbi:MAG: NF038122 family metalloprotease [Verrucomicrobia bacterium]|nr:NF038122 family metalloprotease [Verrucomicrobiota bacterium]